MDVKIDFYDDVNKLSKNIDINHNIKLNLQIYDNIDITNIILKWKQCFEFLGKTDLFISKNVQKIIYCLLSDCNIINSVNGENTNLSFYDIVKQEFLGFDIIDKVNRIIKIKLFNVCNKMVIVDCKGYPIYKIYHLYNLDVVKDYYGKSKVNFDSIMKSICIMPIFVGDINNLLHDYKKLSVDNLNVCNYRNIMYLKLYLAKSRELEYEIHNIQRELRDIYNKEIIKNLTNV
jgi:hypothetical protein